MNARPPHVLVVGYGNPGRRDDGLGPALVAALERRALPGVRLSADYQLMIEDAAEVAEHDAVVFVDAATSGPEPFWFRPLEPETLTSFSTHSVAPAAVLGLARDLFGRTVAGYVLGIRGYEFNTFEEGLSVGAGENLAVAERFLVDLLTNRNTGGAAALRDHASACSLREAH